MPPSSARLAMVHGWAMRLCSNPRPSQRWIARCRQPPHELLRQAVVTGAEQGYSPAQAAAGTMFANGKGTPQSYEEASKWWLKAAEAGHMLAAGNLTSAPRRVEWWNRQPLPAAKAARPCKLKWCVSFSRPIHIIGGGLAGCEAAWQVARAGLPAILYEMRPVRGTPAHKTDRLAELVCSNSLKSEVGKLRAVAAETGASPIGFAFAGRRRHGSRSWRSGADRGPRGFRRRDRRRASKPSRSSSSGAKR